MSKKYTMEEAAGILDSEADRREADLKKVSRDCSFEHWNSECSAIGAIRRCARILREEGECRKGGV